MPEQIHLTVAVSCFRDGHLLMVEEKDQGRLVLNQPAGHVEPGESLTAAALRETLEETGYRVKLESLLGISINKAANGITYYRVSFMATCLEQQPSGELDKDIERAVWMTPEEILARDNHRSALVDKDVHRFLSGTRYPLEMIEENA
jgi:ADP-ribose pyrophosphatase YjhB (NUDIX family)